MSGGVAAGCETPLFFINLLGRSALNGSAAVLCMNSHSDLRGAAALADAMLAGGCRHE